MRENESGFDRQEIALFQETLEDDDTFTVEIDRFGVREQNLVALRLVVMEIRECIETQADRQTHRQLSYIYLDKRYVTFLIN